MFLLRLTKIEEKNQLQLDALVKVGLLKKTQEIKQGIGWDKKLLDDVFFTVNIYTLTDEGKETNHKSSGFFGEHEESLCYAHPQVDSILNYAEEKFSGQDLMEVKYSYQYVDVADWAMNKEVQTEFPEINKILNASDKTSKITLIKTNNGWQTDL